MPPRRTLRPLYVDRLPPCNQACPAGENVQAWLAEAQAGNYRAAWDLILRDNPLPAVEGRVCCSRISGRPRAGRTSGALCPTSWRCRVREAPPASSTGRSRPAR
jgi:hypothetical protein